MVGSAYPDKPNHYRPGQQLGGGRQHSDDQVLLPLQVTSPDLGSDAG